MVCHYYLIFFVINEEQERNRLLAASVWTIGRYTTFSEKSRTLE